MVHCSPTSNDFYDMDFVVKKIVSALLLPLPVALLCLLIGLICLWSNRNKLIISIWLLVGVLILLLFSFSPLPTKLLSMLENQHRPLTQLPTNIRAIVVLGGGVRNNTNAPPNTQVTSASLSRLIEGIRLANIYQQHGTSVQLILSGGRVFGKPADAGIMQNIAMTLGIKSSNIEIEDGSRDTREEAAYLKLKLKHTPFILVTSAYHMPRALKAFALEGLYPTPAPTQFIAGTDRRLPRYYFPAAKYMATADIALHEYLGTLWLDFNQ